MLEHFFKLFLANGKLVTREKARDMYVFMYFAFFQLKSTGAKNA